MGNLVDEPVPSKSWIRQFLGKPVLMQFKIPLLMIEIREAQAISHADEPERRQWIPGEAYDGEPGASRLAVREYVRYAVIERFDRDLVFFSWLAPCVAGPATLTSFVHISDIAAVTLVNAAPPVPPIPAEPTLVQLAR